MVEMDSPSLKGFHAQLDCRITANTRIVYIVSCSRTHAEQNRNDGKYRLTGIAVKIRTNHEGVGLQANGLNSTCRTISVCELLQIVNSHGLTFLTALVLRPFRASGQN